MDGDTQLDCRVRQASELPLGVVPHLQGEDPTTDEGMDHPRPYLASVLKVLDRIQQVGHMLPIGLQGR